MLGAAQKVTGEMMLVVAWYREDGAVLDISHVEKKNIEPRGKMPSGPPEPAQGRLRQGISQG